MKSDYRTRAKNIRKNIDTEKISKEICSKIRELDCYKSAQNVMIFYPMKYEINLLELLNDKKKFYLPKVFETDILVCPYTEDLEKSELNILEPCTNPINPNTLDLVFVPALMADEENYRLGYGGGFYDRFLKQYSNITTIVPIAKELIIKKLPRDSWDIAVDLVIKA